MNITSNNSRKFWAINKVKYNKILEICQEDNNKKCFDCQSLNPQYISLYNGIFICRRCAIYIHKNLNPNISLILDNNLNKLSIKEIQYLYYGGNKKLLDFINYEYPILKSISKNKLYLTKGLEYYRHWLKYLITEGEKPLKPSFEECSKLINDPNKKKFNKNVNKGNIINIDFINNFYNYEDDDKFNIINPTIYEKTYTSNWFNHLNRKNDFSTYNKENDINLSNNLNTTYYNNNTLMNENEKNYYYINNDYNNNNLNKKIIKIDKFNTNINNSSINGNKLITKKLSLKSKNKSKNLSMSRNENSSNIINKTFMNIFTNDEKTKIYSKPIHNLLSSFQNNPLTRNRIEKEDLTHRTFIIPTGKNYQSILIKDNNFDKLLNNNFTDRTNIPNDHLKMNETQIFKTGELLNSKKILNCSSNFENTNIDSNKELTLFKKKYLKNSFSINTKKIKEKKDNITQSIVEENTNFEIIPNKNLENIINEKKHRKLNSTIPNNYSIGNKKDIEILNEIKVKKRERYIIAGNKYNNKTLNKFSSRNNLEKYETINKNDKNLSQDNSKNTEKGKMRKLLTLTRLFKDKKKIPIPKLNLKNNILINDKKNKIYETERGKDGIISKINNKILSNKIDKQKQSFDKKPKDISLLKNQEKKVKAYKTEINFNKSLNNLVSRPKYKSKRNDLINPYQNQINKNNNLKGNKNEYNNVNKTQRQKEIFNYLLSKKLNN